ncbi:mitochondrial proton/calcium exchanger protein [Parasteatoda tepidariorum]|uniref:mitochondrial proton/calcium exchanger protein n=1 Tax=Parasteatoda tepidariorum TaxID=114398 RepID=UPI0039BC8119
MELLLPVFLKFFPSMLPSTFQTKSATELKFKKNLRMKIEMAKFLQDTLDELAVSSKGDSHSDTAKEFVTFFDKIRSTGEQATNVEILKFSKLFEDEVTLENLSRPQLIALCRLLELQPIGTNNFLRFQLRNKIRNLRADDRMIQKEGIENLTITEVQAACRARGMRALGIPEHRLRSSLLQWLELSLNEKIPPSLLLLSRALYLPENVPTTDQLKVTLSSLPETATTETKFKIGEMEGKVDNKTKLELIKKEEAEIRKEAEEIKQQELDKQKLQQKTDLETADKDMLIDKAPVLDVLSGKTIAAKSDEIKKEEELSREDFEEIENALENIASEKNKLLIEKEEIEDLKEEMAEYKQDIEELKDVVLETGHKEIRESKAASRLSNKVNKMVSKMDGLIHNLTEEKVNLEQQIQDKEKEGVTPLKERDDIVSINDLVTAIRKIRKVSDESKLQQIAEVLEKLDVDRDGSVEIDDLLKVIELLENEDVKVTKKQMDDIIELLLKEETLEKTEKKLRPH